MLWCTIIQQFSCPFTDFSGCSPTKYSTSPSVTFVVTPCFLFHAKCQGFQSIHLTCPPQPNGPNTLSFYPNVRLLDGCPLFDMAPIVITLKCARVMEMLWNNIVMYILFALSNESKIRVQANGLCHTREMLVFMKNKYAEFWHCRPKMRVWKGPTMLYS